MTGLEEIVMILDLHRQGAGVSAIARRTRWIERIAPVADKGYLKIDPRRRNAILVLSTAVAGADFFPSLPLL